MDRAGIPGKLSTVPLNLGSISPCEEGLDVFDEAFNEDSSFRVGRSQLLSDIQPPREMSGELEEMRRRARNPKFIAWRDNLRQSLHGFTRSREQQVDDVRCMFNLSSDKSVPRPVMLQDGGLHESTVMPHSADQLLLDLKQLGLVRAKDAANKGASSQDGRTDREPILKDLKLVQECPIERPVFHCFLKELSISQEVMTCLVTVEQQDDAFVMVAYSEPSEGQPMKFVTELARFPKFPQLTDGFCMSANGDAVVFTCTLLGCLLYVSLYSCSVEADAAAAISSADVSAEANQRHSSLMSGRKENLSHNSSQSSAGAAAPDQTFRFRKDRPVPVAESNYKLSEPISEHVYDVCIRDVSNSGSGSKKSFLYVTNKSNIAVVSLSSLKLENFLFEGLKLPWRLKLHKHLLIIAEKWGSIQIADLEKGHRSLCVMDMQGLCCENGLKAIEVVMEHNMLLLTVYPEGNHMAGHYPEDQTSSAGEEGAGTGAAGAIGGGGRDSSGRNNRIGGLGSFSGRCWTSHGGDSGDDVGWSCHCFHFNPESTHGNPMLRYAQTLRLSRAPLSCIYSPFTKHLYVLCFHPARNNSALLMMNLEVFHEEHGRSSQLYTKQMLPQKDEDEYKAAMESINRRPVGFQDVPKSVEMVDFTGSPLVVAMKRPTTFGFT